jgi:hypothetical protein
MKILNWAVVTGVAALVLLSPLLMRCMYPLSLDAEEELAEPGEVARSIETGPPADADCEYETVDSKGEPPVLVCDKGGYGATSAVAESAEDPQEAPRESHRQRHSEHEPLFLMTLLRSAPFYLLMVCMVCALGFPITLLNNLAPLVASMHGEIANKAVLPELLPGIKLQIAILVPLFAVGNAWGRMLCGVAMDRWSAGLPRWLWFVVAIAFQAVVNAVLLVDWGQDILFAVVPLAGVTLGFFFTAGPTAVSDIFGPAHFPSCWGIVTIAPCLSTEVLGTLVAGRVADHVAAESFFVANERVYCLGEQCYRITFGVTLLVLLVALVFAGTLLKMLLRHP